MQGAEIRERVYPVVLRFGTLLGLRGAFAPEADHRNLSGDRARRGIRYGLASCRRRIWSNRYALAQKRLGKARFRALLSHARSDGTPRPYPDVASAGLRRPDRLGPAVQGLPIYGRLARRALLARACRPLS